MCVCLLFELKRFFPGLKHLTHVSVARNSLEQGACRLLGALQSCAVRELNMAATCKSFPLKSLLDCHSTTDFFQKVIVLHLSLCV